MQRSSDKVLVARRILPELISPRNLLPYAASLAALAFVLGALFVRLGAVRHKAEQSMMDRSCQAALLVARAGADGCSYLFTDSRPIHGGVCLAPSPDLLGIAGAGSGNVFVRDAGATMSPWGLAADPLMLEAIDSESGIATSGMGEPGIHEFRVAAAWPPGRDGWRAAALLVFPVPNSLSILEGLRGGGLAVLFAIAVLVTYPAFILLRLSGMRRRRELEVFEDEPGIDPPQHPVPPERMDGDNPGIVLSRFEGTIPVAELDEAGIVRNASPAFADMLDTRLEDLVGEPLSAAGCFDPATRGRLEDDLLSTLSGNQLLSVVSSDGRMRHVRPYVSSTGTGGGSVIVLSDYSEIETLRSEREKLLEREMALNSYAVLATMVRGFSHDLNNLLAGVIGAASLGEAVHEGSSPDRQRYSAILAAAERAAAVSDELQHTASLTEAQARPLEPSLELEEIAEALRSVLPRTISLEVSLPSGLPMLIADRALLRQVLYNLALRSSGALQGSGRIRFVAEEVPDPSTDPRFMGVPRNPGRTKCICISVSDGTVLPQGLLRLISSADADSYEIERNYGAGMAAVSQAVRALKGCIASSVETRGTVLRMLFPAADRPSAPDRIPPSGAAGTGISVLIAEEESIVRETTRQILEHFGFRAAEAESGDEALAILDQENFDALLLDMGAFGTPSVEVARMCRDRWPGMAVLLTSGYETPSGLDDPSLKPGTGFLRKPYFPEAVAAEIIRLLGTLGR